MRIEPIVGGMVVAAVLFGVQRAVWWLSGKPYPYRNWPWFIGRKRP